MRGLAVLAVVIYHCHPRLEGTPVHYASLWGWAGVNLFFVLSGFLITSILLEARNKQRYFRNFYGRRALRIWPVYVLVLIVVYLNAPWFIGPTISQAIKTAPWLAYIFLRAEPVPHSHPAGDRAHLVARYRRAVLLPLGAPCALLETSVGSRPRSLLCAHRVAGIPRLPTCPG